MLMIMGGIAGADAVTARQWPVETERVWNSLLAWRGTAIVAESIDGGAWSPPRRIEFVMDRRRRALRWVETSADSAFVGAVLIKHGHIYRLSGPGGARAGVIDVSDLSGHNAALCPSECDPIAWLTLGLSSTPIAFSRPGGPLGLDEWEFTGHVDRRMQLQRDGTAAAVTFDSQSGRLQSIQFTGQDAREDWHVNWRRQGDVLVPVQVVHQVATTEGRTTQRTIALQESIVNEPVDPGEWSLSRIAAEDGALVRDELRGVQYVQHGDSVSHRLADDPRSDVSSRIVILNVAAWTIILGLLVFFCRRRAARSSSTGVDLPVPRGASD